MYKLKYSYFYRTYKVDLYMPVGALFRFFVGDDPESKLSRFYHVISDLDNN